MSALTKLLRRSVMAICKMTWRLFREKLRNGDIDCVSDVTFCRGGGRVDDDAFPAAG
jgi:hypothetical protein